jgi:hypothetical protein
MSCWRGSIWHCGGAGIRRARALRRAGSGRALYAENGRKADIAPTCDARPGTYPPARRPIKLRLVALPKAPRRALSLAPQGECGTRAGTGLVAGGAVGAGNARAAGGSLQARYDTVYAQCMSAKGNRVAGPPVAGPVYAYPCIKRAGGTFVARLRSELCRIIR